MSSSFLEQVTRDRRDDARRRMADGALEAAEAKAEAAPLPRNLHAALSAESLAIIAEVKRASPSAGVIADDVDPVVLAEQYERGGASAVSVLTEPDHFNGSLEDLSAVRASVGLPVLRKDFLCEPLHVYEARAAGADAVLLIVAALEQDELRALLQLARSLGMTALVEVHDEPEVASAVAAEARIIGINTRNLATLEVDPTVVGRLRPAVPSGVVVVGESGIRSRADVAAMEEAGCDAVLVGETLMRAPDPARAIAELLGR